MAVAVAEVDVLVAVRLDVVVAVAVVEAAEDEAEVLSREVQSTAINMGWGESELDKRI